MKSTKWPMIEGRVTNLYRIQNKPVLTLEITVLNIQEEIE